jgi:general secretion pathway protein S
MLISLRNSSLVAALVFLAGCQQQQAPVNKTQPLASTQVEQLSALLAGGHFLRTNCNRADIPDDVKLQRTAMRIAEHRGWNTRATEYQQLPARTQARYDALMQDSTPIAEKCTTLNQSTARFITAAQTDQMDYIE